MHQSLSFPCFFCPPLKRAAGGVGAGDEVIVQCSHSGQFRRCAAGDLLCSQLSQLQLQLLELLLQVLLVLGPELGGLHFRGRLQIISIPYVESTRCLLHTILTVFVKSKVSIVSSLDVSSRADFWVQLLGLCALAPIKLALSHFRHPAYFCIGWPVRNSFSTQIPTPHLNMDR